MTTNLPSSQITIFQPAADWSTFAPLGVLDTFESGFFTRDWSKPGPFQLVINWNVVDDTGLNRYASMLAFGNIIMLGNDPTKVWLITNTTKHEEAPGKGAQKVTVSGFELSYIFKWRLCVVPTSFDNYVLTGPAESVMKQAISDQAGPTVSNAARQMSLLSIVATRGLGTTYSLSSNYKSLSDELTACSVASKLGIQVSLDLVNKKFIVDCLVGGNKVAGQSFNCIFSTDYDTLKSSDLTQTIEQFFNVCTVAGAGKGQARIVQAVFSGAEPSDLNRREMFLNDSTVPDAATATIKGNAQLLTYQYQSQVAAQALTYSQLGYGVDYFLGDFVSISTYGVTKGVQITQTKESFGAGQYTLDLTFDKPAPEITTQVATAVSGIVNQTSALGTNSISTVITGTVLAKAVQDDNFIVNSGAPSTQDILTNGASAPGLMRRIINVGAGLVSVHWSGSVADLTVTQGQIRGFIYAGSGVGWVPMPLDSPSGATLPTWLPFPAGTYAFPSGNQTVTAGVCPVGATTTAPGFGAGTIKDYHYMDNGNHTINLMLNLWQTTIGTSTGSGIFLLPIPTQFKIDTSIVRIGANQFNGGNLGFFNITGNNGGSTYVMQGKVSPHSNILIRLGTGLYAVAATDLWSNAYFPPTSFSEMYVSFILSNIPVVPA